MSDLYYYHAYVGFERPARVAIVPVIRRLCAELDSKGVLYTLPAEKTSEMLHEIGVDDNSGLDELEIKHSAWLLLGAGDRGFDLLAQGIALRKRGLTVTVFSWDYSATPDREFRRVLTANGITFREGLSEQSMIQEIVRLGGEQVPVPVRPRYESIAVLR